MTGKERIRAVLHHESTDRMAFVPCIDPYFRSGLDSPFQQMAIHELQALCGSDMLRGVSCCQTRFDETVRHVQEQGSQGEIVNHYETPAGNLREVHQFTEQSPYIPFPKEHLIKTLDDLKTFRYLIRHAVVEPDYEQAHRLISTFNQLMVSCSVEDSAFRQLLTKKIGVENFVYFMCDDPSEIEETLQVLAEHHDRMLDVAARGPTEVYIAYENTNTDNSSIVWFNQYELPMLNRYADIVHGHGKKLLIHMCGRIRLLVDEIVNARFDGIIDVPQPPTGNLVFQEEIGRFSKSGKILAGGIDCTVYIEKDESRFEKEVARLVDALKDSPGFMLGSGDAVPQGATLKHFEIIHHILDNHLY